MKYTKLFAVSLLVLGHSIQASRTSRSSGVLLLKKLPRASIVADKQAQIAANEKQIEKNNTQIAALRLQHEQLRQSSISNDEFKAQTQPLIDTFTVLNNHNIQLHNTIDFLTKTQKPSLLPVVSKESNV